MYPGAESIALEASLGVRHPQGATVAAAVGPLARSAVALLAATAEVAAPAALAAAGPALARAVAAAAAAAQGVGEGQVAAAAVALAVDAAAAAAWLVAPPPEVRATSVASEARAG